MSVGIVVNNLADLGTWTASGSNTLSPVSNLQNEHVSVKWVLNGTTAYAICDLGSVKSVDTLAMIGVSGSNPTFRARFSVADVTGVTTSGGGFDSGSVSGTPYFDPVYGKFIYLLTTPVSVRYVRYDVTEAATVSQAAGRGVIGLRDAFSNGIQAPYRRTSQRRSAYARGYGGSTFVDRRKGNWMQQVSMGFMTDTERTTFMETLAAKVVNAGHADFLWVPDTTSLNLSRDCLWGFHSQDEMNMVQNVYVVPPLWGLELQIEDRG